jgi:predicted nucleotidyltransferase
MQRIVTLTEHKQAEAARRQAAVAALVPVLSDYARARGGRFLLFGSAARGAMTFRSDVDLLLDFPPDAVSAAWVFAETACWDRGLEPDILTFAGCKKAFLDHIAPDVRVLA